MRYLKPADIEHKNVLVVGIGGIGSLLVQIAKELGAHVDIVCSKDARDLAYRLKPDNIFCYDEFSDHEEMVEKIGNDKNGEKYSVVMDCARAANIEASSISWIGYLIDPNDTVVYGFNSPELAIKDGMHSILGTR